MIFKKINITVEITKTGFSAFADEYPIFTTGKNLNDLMTNIVEAGKYYFEGNDIELGLDNFNINIDFVQFFNFYKVINSRFLAEKIGMNPTLLSQYVTGHKKPSQKQT